MHIPTFVFIFILFRTNILLLLLYPKHFIKLFGYNLGCYICTAQRGQLMQESSALTKEVSSALHKGQLMQESLALTKEVSSALHKRSAHAGELSSALHKRSAHAGELSSNPRGQFGQMSSSTAHPLIPF